MSINEALSYIRGCSISRENALYILTKVLEQDNSFVYANPGHILDEAQIAYLKDIIRQHVDELKPLAYIFREAYFCGRPFHSDERALIPRMETEILVDVVLNILQNREIPGLSILDICTGSGIIPVTLSLSLPDAVVYASDISDGALELAKSNAQLYGRDILFIRSDIFDDIPDIRFDIITANPPYIGSTQKERVDESVLRHEPHLALFGGDDGLVFIRRILSGARYRLKPGGYLVMEIESGQGKSVLHIASEYGYKGVIKKDMAGLDRLLVATGDFNNN